MAFSPSSRTLRLTAALWTLLIFVALSVPNPTSGSAPSSTDKVAHFLLFAAFGGLWMHALRVRRAPLLRSAGCVLFWGTIYGMLLEVYQGLLPALGRSAELLDALADTLGLGTAVAVYVLWKRGDSR